MNMVVNRFRFACCVVFGLAAALVPGAAFAVEADNSASLDCSSIVDDALRLVCFDNLFSQPQPPVGDPPVSQSPPSPVAEQVPLSDDVGRETLGQSEDDIDLAVRGRLIKCPKNARGKLYFYFENGQVWEKKDSTRVTWKNCSFYVTIQKDYFGYKLSREGEKRYLRVARIR